MDDGTTANEKPKEEKPLFVLREELEIKKLELELADRVRGMELREERVKRDIEEHEDHENRVEAWKKEREYREAHFAHIKAMPDRWKKDDEDRAINQQACKDQRDQLQRMADAFEKVAAYLIDKE